MWDRALHKASDGERRLETFILFLVFWVFLFRAGWFGVEGPSEM